MLIVQLVSDLQLNQPELILVNTFEQLGTYLLQDSCLEFIKLNKLNNLSKAAL